MLVVVNTAVLLLFALHFIRPRTSTIGALSECSRHSSSLSLWRCMVSPLTIYLLSGWLCSNFTDVNLLSHDSGHLWSTRLGWQGDPHFSPFHLLSYVLIGGGFILIASAWDVLYKAQREQDLATTGLYARPRHSQYVGFVLIMLGFYRRHSPITDTT